MTKIIRKEIEKIVKESVIDLEELPVGWERVEWGENFSEQVDTEPIKYKHDLIEGLWG